MHRSFITLFRIYMTFAASVGIGTGLLIATDGIRHGIPIRFVLTGFVLGGILSAVSAAILVLSEGLRAIFKISLEDAAEPVRAKLQRRLWGLCLVSWLVGTVALLGFMIALAAAISRIAEGKPMLS
jgi:hypothetical protein